MLVVSWKQVINNVLIMYLLIINNFQTRHYFNGPIWQLQLTLKSPYGQWFLVISLSHLYYIYIVQRSMHNSNIFVIVKVIINITIIDIILNSFCSLQTWESIFHRARRKARINFSNRCESSWKFLFEGPYWFVIT